MGQKIREMTTMNPEDKGRRDVLKGALGTGVLAAGAVTAPGLLFPALAQGENLVPFTDDASEAFQWRPIENQWSLIAAFQ